MGISGAQDFWFVGSAVMFRRDSAAGEDFAWRDWGVIEQVTPSLEAETSEVTDPRCGRRETVDEQVVSQTESYEIQLRNFAMRNLEYLFGSKAVESITIAGTEKTADVPAAAVEAGSLVLWDDPDLAIPAANIASVERVTGARHNIIAVDSGQAVGSMTITISGDQTADLASGDSIRVRDNTGAGVDATVTANAVALSGSDTVITVDEDISGYDATGTAAELFTMDTDWEVVDLIFGSIRIIDGGGIATGRGIAIDYTPNAVSGERKLQPQSAGQIKGEARIYLNRGGACDQVTIRRARVSIVVSGNSLSVDEPSSFTVTAKILRDPTTEKFGEVVYARGDLPSLS